MTEKTVGYVELEWTCPTCGNKNPGLTKSCASCGAPQPQNTQFELGGQPNLIEDAKKAEAAAKGADIHCPYCNTRNPADAQVCMQCGGDLKEAVKRESGRVLSGTVIKEIKCPACGSSNPANGLQCQRCGASLAATPAPKPAAAAGQSAFRPWMALPVIAILLSLCCLIGYFLFRTTTLMGQVQDAHWERTIAIEAQREVTRKDWRDQLPSDAKVLGCQEKYRSRQDSPAPGAKEVCSTQLVDQGNGSAKVVESCYYEIYDDYCEYQALEWQSIDQAQASGNDLQPYWPQVSLSGAEREGQRSETYTVTFDTKDGYKQFTTSDAALFSQLQPGTEWNLVVNTLGGIVEVSPP
jgi:DNA-directed RNA polymerase subunit RPC12/RpoP